MFNTSSKKYESLIKEIRKGEHEFDNEQKYLLIKIGWEEYIFPYEEGIDFMNAFTSARKLKIDADEVPTVEPVNKYDVTSQIISKAQFYNYRMGHILGVSHKKINEMREAYLKGEDYDINEGSDGSS